MSIFLPFVLLSCVLLSGGFQSENTKIDTSGTKGFNVTCHWKKGNTKMKVYWINLTSNVVRRQFMEAQLRELGMQGQRIEAITPTSSSFNVTKLVKTCKRNTDRDIAVITSHLTG